MLSKLMLIQFQLQISTKILNFFYYANKKCYQCIN
jgi:hypothetical protein